jgi:NADP-dependent 3-hydroxy acid dehydrogenase YdfG
MKKVEKIILITGASSGIGEALAYQWSKEGHFLILLALYEDELRQVQNKCAYPDKCKILPLFSG